MLTVSGLVVTGLSGDYAIVTGRASAIIEDCFIDANGNKAIECLGTGTVVRGCIIKDATRGIDFPDATSYLHVSNCVFYNTTVACIYNQTVLNSTYSYNNIFHVAVPAADYALSISAGPPAPGVHTDYCWTNSTIANTWGVTGTEEATRPPNCLHNDDDGASGMIDPANDNYKLGPTSILLNRGKPTIEDGYSSIGAWQRIGRIRRDG